MFHFKIDADYIELVKLLKAVGLCNTGGEAKIAVISGTVKYNGVVDTRKRLKIHKGDVVEYMDQKIVVE